MLELTSSFSKEELLGRKSMKKNSVVSIETSSKVI
jgi:hypothetical protein